jgi:hypothetical protein
VSTTTDKFDLKSAVPELLRRDIEWGERTEPPVPDDVPAVADADPSWRRRWLAARERLRARAAKSAEDLTEGWDEVRRDRFGRLLAAIGWGELRRIVDSCTWAAAHYEMPAAWRACIVKQAYEDMQHSASFITRGCRWSGRNWWNGIEGTATFLDTTAEAILKRDLGGFFAVVGLHTEAYAAEDGGAYTALLSLDPVLARWSPHEIEQEAAHLSFLLPAMREYLNSGAAAERERKKRVLVSDNEALFASMRTADTEALARFAVERLGLDRSLIEWRCDLKARTRYLYRAIGIEESCWPASLA